MQVNIDIEHVANKTIDYMIDKIDPNLSLDGEIRKEILEKIKTELIESNDGFETLLELLLIRHIKETTNQVVSNSSELFKIFGGLVNHD